MVRISPVVWMVEKQESLFYLYNLIDTNKEIIYVGMSVDPNSRFSQHKKEKTDAVGMIVVQSHKTSRECAIAELEEIGRLLPRLNVLERDRHAKLMEGVARAKQRGVYKGRKHVLTDDQVKECRALIKSGVTKTQVAKQFSVSRQTLYTALATR